MSTRLFSATVMPPNFAFPRAEEMPVTFNFPREAQLWVPFAIPDAPRGGPSEMAVIARVRPGVSLNQVQAQMDLIARHAEQKLPAWKGWMNTRQIPLATQVVGDTRGPLLLILGAVGVVLLIACSNAANLLLARALARKRGFTLRTALGSSRSRLIRQLLTESLLLALAGGAVGVFLAEAGIHFAKTLGPANLPRLHEVGMDMPVLCFVSAASLLTGICFGLFPALAATRENLAESLKEGSQRSAGNLSSSRIQNSLLVSQVALALVLVISTGLLAKTFFYLLNTDAGFSPQRTLTFELSLPQLQYPDQQHIVTLYRNVLEKLNEVPGVHSAGIGETVPLSGQGESTVIRLPDRPAANLQEMPFANYTIVSFGYLSAVGTSLIHGRDFLESDTLNSMPVTIINLSMAKKFWPAQNPLGKQVGVGSSRYPLTTIVGIVADAKHVSLREEPMPEMYVPYTQNVWPSMLTMHVAIRTNSDPTNVTASVRDGDSFDRSGFTAGEAFDSLAPGRRFHGYAAILRAIAGIFRGAGIGARMHRDVRSDFLFGFAAHTRDRHPYGARSASPRRVLDDSCAGCSARRAGSCDRLTCCGRGDSRHGGVALRRTPN
jgi:putative ABC transport system permease protein